MAAREIIMGISDKRFALLKETLERLPLKMTDEMYRQLLLFYDLLVEKNKVMNLTAITEFQEVLEKHFLDSLSLIYVANPENRSMIDLGSGAGFPGIPLKIAFPESKMILADSLQKRITFLNDVIARCKLEEIHTIHGRAEDLGNRKSELRGQFDLCVSRAVANLSSLSEYCIPFVKREGRFVAYKAGNVLDEVNTAKHAIAVLGGEVENVYSFTLPGTDLNRSLVVIHKVKDTPGAYPRKAGLPGKQPL